MTDLIERAELINKNMVQAKEIERLKIIADTNYNKWREQVEYTKRLRAALEPIKWKSCHKDNMEFTATISCYHMDKIREALKDD